MLVSNVMSTNVASATRESTLASVARLMAEHDCGAIPVVDDAGQPVGIVSDRDIVLRTLGNGRDASELTAGEVMSVPCVTVSQNADLAACLGMMEANQIRRVVVIDGAGRTCGIVSQADIAFHASRRKVGGVVERISRPEATQDEGAGQATAKSRAQLVSDKVKENPITVGSVLATIGVIGIAAWYLRQRGTRTVAKTLSTALLARAGVLQTVGEQIGSQVADVVGRQAGRLADRFGAVSHKIADAKDDLRERFA